MLLLVQNALLASCLLTGIELAWRTLCELVFFRPHLKALASFSVPLGSSTALPHWLPCYPGGAWGLPQPQHLWICPSIWCTFSWDLCLAFSLTFGFPISTFPTPLSALFFSWHYNNVMYLIFCLFVLLIVFPITKIYKDNNIFCHVLWCIPSALNGAWHFLDKSPCRMGKWNPSSTLRPCPRPTHGSYLISSLLA